MNGNKITKGVFIENGAIRIFKVVQESQSINPDQYYDREILSDRIVLTKCEPKLGFKFYKQSSGLIMTIRPEYIPDNLRETFTKKTPLIYESNQDQIILSWKT